MEGRSNSILHILKYCATLLCGRTEPFPCINNKSLQKIRTLRSYKYISDWINPSLLPQQLVGERTSRFIWTETIPFIGLIFNNTSILIFMCVWVKRNFTSITTQIALRFCLCFLCIWPIIYTMKNSFYIKTSQG